MHQYTSEREQREAESRLAEQIKRDWAEEAAKQPWPRPYPPKAPWGGSEEVCPDCERERSKRTCPKCPDCDYVQSWVPGHVLDVDIEAMGEGFPSFLRRGK